LRDAIDSIDTSVEIGEGSTLSGDYLDSLQKMIDSGSITEDQLQSLFRAKGYELKVTGWKKISGPEKTITQTIHQEGKPDITKTITEQEKINVPIINGDTSSIEDSEITLAAGVSKVSAASYVKSSNPAGLSTITSDERKRDKASKLEEARYHEIGEVLEDLENDYDRISEAKDRAFGADKLVYMDAEIAKL
jgi:transposase